jgi:hypothetical protein
VLARGALVAALVERGEFDEAERLERWAWL